MKKLNPESSIGSRIKWVRDYARLSQTDFATRLGISQSYLSAVEKGRYAANLAIVTGIVTNFPTINPIWLLKGEASEGEVIKKGDPDDEATPGSDIDKGCLEIAVTLLNERLSREGGQISSETQADFISIIYKYAVAILRAQMTSGTSRENGLGMAKFHSRDMAFRINLADRSVSEGSAGEIATFEGPFTGFVKEP